MVIEKEKLISLLAEKTGLEREEAEVQLAGLVDSIQKAGSSGEPFLIEGLGTFNSSDGDLQFVPTHILETEINHKYAGMKPIELIGAFKESGAGEIAAFDEVRTKEGKIAWTFDEQAAEAELSGELAEGSEEEFAPVEANKKDDEENKNGEEAKENQEKDTQAEPEPALSAASPENGESRSESTSLTSSNKKGSEKKVEVATSESKNDTLSLVLTGMIILLVIGVVGWFIYDLGFRGDQNTEPNSPPQTGQQQTPATEPPLDNQTPDLEESADGDTKENQTQGNTESLEPEQNSSVSTEEQAGRQPESEQPYGLMGDVNSNISSGYMIVLHSRRRMDLAQENKQELEEAGYRTIINRADVSGQVQYRVGVGQFETIENALQAVNKLPEPYKSNNFIKRIR